MKYQNFNYLSGMKVKNKTENKTWVTIKIDPSLYDLLKKYCTERGLKLGHVAGKAIEREIKLITNPEQVIYR